MRYQEGVLLKNADQNGEKDRCKSAGTISPFAIWIKADRAAAGDVG